jgi:hypothetical protein
MGIIDPNWVMACCALLTILGGFSIWLTSVFLDIRIIKNGVADLKDAKHKDREVLNNHELRISILENENAE